MAKIFSIIISVVIAMAVLTTSTHAGLIYSKPAFRGKILDAESKKPIEGAVVVAIHSKETGSPFGTGSSTTIIGLSETLTDRDGSFDIPSYTTVINPLSRSNDVEFIVFKAGYGPMRETGFLYTTFNITSIAAIKPSTIDYLEEYKDEQNEKRIDYAVRKHKTFPEGLVYSLGACKKKLESIKQTTPFDIKYFFLHLKDAAKKMERLEVPLECPDSAEPVPTVPVFDMSYDYRNEVEENILKSFVIVELPKLKTREERIKAHPAPVGEQNDWKKQKQLIKAIRQEMQYLYNKSAEDLYKVKEEAK